MVVACIPLFGTAQVKIVGEWPSKDTSSIHVLTTTYGDTLKGRLVQLDSSSVVFVLKIGDTLNYPAHEVVSVKIGEPLVPKKDIVAERLLVSPTAFSLKKGENEYRNIMLFYNSYHRGITDKIMIGGGVLPLFITYQGWIDGKYSVEVSKNLHLGISGVLGGGPSKPIDNEYGEEDWSSHWFAGATGALTIGPRDKFINISLTRFSYDNFTNGFLWFFSVGGSHRILKNGRLFVEVKSLFGFWPVVLGFNSLHKRRSIDAVVFFFPNQKPQFLPGFAFGKRF